MGWCAEIKKQIRNGNITKGIDGWYLCKIKITYCPWCKATLIPEDY